MTEYPWYGLTDADELLQGDLLFACPFDRVDAPGQADRANYNVVVMSHSCDLTQDKLDLIQVCPFFELEKLAEQVEYFRGKRGREEIRRGNAPGYHLLNCCTLTELSTGFLVVDFRSQFAVDNSTLKSLAAGQKPRLRLLPPYREHLAQALARFYMRVGLPVDIPPTF
jgi:hypothetical protein